MDSEKKIIGRCPFCGGNVVKTCKGYRCENNTGEHPSCVLNINAIIGNRKMNDEEIAEFLEKRRILLDGFSTKEGMRRFSIVNSTLCRPSFVFFYYSIPLSSRQSSCKKPPSSVPDEGQKKHFSCCGCGCSCPAGGRRRGRC